MTIPHAYYINSNNEVSVDNLLKLGFQSNNIHRFISIDQTNIIEDLKSRHFSNEYLINYLKCIPVTFERKQFASFLSHYFCLHTIFDNSYIKQNELVYIFENSFTPNIEKEEDFIQINNTLQEFNMKNDIDIIYLGGYPLTEKYIPSDLSLNELYIKEIDNLYLRKKSNDTNRVSYAYVINKQSIPRIISSIIQFFQQDKLYQKINEINQIYLSNNVRYKLNIYDYFPHIIDRLSEEINVSSDNTFSLF